MPKHIIDTRQFKQRDFLEPFFELTAAMEHNRWDPLYSPPHHRKMVGSFFWEPSTRTKTTFDAAAKFLGAQVVGTEDAGKFSSATKGESIKHTIYAIGETVDAFVIRHPENGAAECAARAVDVGINSFQLHLPPIINAGDGTNQHPTQSLLDMYTINRECGAIDNQRVTFVGDIAHGRTVRSLAYLLAQLEGNELTFVSPPETCLPDDMRAYLEERGTTIHETTNLDDALPETNVLYVTRLQLERLRPEVRQRLLGEYRKFQITTERADQLSINAIIMHPLPINIERSNGFPEITPEVDVHPRSRYFQQSNNGLYVRMALLDIVLTGPSHNLYNTILEYNQV